MGQYWKLIAPRLRAYMPFDARKLGEIYFHVSHWGPNGLVYLLATPVAQQKAMQDTVDGENHNEQPFKGDQAGEQHISSASTPSVTIGSSPTLTGLPTEVHRRIFDELKEDIDAIVRLGTTSQHFWTTAKEYVYVHCKTRFGRWAGEPLVCVGDYAKASDYPPGLFSKEELEIMRQEGCDIPVQGDDDDGDYYDYVDDDDYFLDGDDYVTPNDSWEFRLESYRNLYLAYEADMGGARLPRDMDHIYFRMYKSLLDAKHPSRNTINSDMDAIADMENYLPKSEAWILRNLTTKQFVRAEAIALEPEYVHGPFHRGLGFGHVILARICWSAQDSCSMLDVNNITRGVWAGHRFDIVTQKVHDKETRALSEEAWEDVSDEVAQEIRSIWEASLGPKWRKELEELPGHMVRVE
jgi:hypothetical protein